MKHKPNTYYKLHNPECLDDDCIVYYYKNPDYHMDPNGPFDPERDYSAWGFGFNVADGGGFIHEDGLTEGTIVVELSIMTATD